MRNLLFTLSMTCIARTLLLRDRLLGRVQWRSPRNFASDSGAVVSRHSIPSGNNALDAVFAAPTIGAPLAVLLICHGIGETVEHWVPVQRLLAANSAASLVFDYSGYGKSTGLIRASQCADDAVAAFAFLQGMVPSIPAALLGFSLGSGIATAILNRIPADRLVLCAGFTSFRAAGHSLGIPKFFAPGMPDLWHAKVALRECRVPVLVVHGEQDPLFPVAMATELAGHCGPDTKLLIVPNLTHNEPFYRPDLSYWGLILSWLMPSIDNQKSAPIQP